MMVTTHFAELMTTTPGNSLIFSITAIFVGVGGLAISWWLRRGSEGARFWLNSDGIVDERFALILTPGVSAFFFGFGMFQHVMWFPPTLKLIFGTLFATIAIIGLVFTIWGLFPIKYPESFRPQWLREYYVKHPHARP